MIPQGYKQTEIGIIPQEWYVTTLGAICNNIYSGKNKAKSVFGNYPVYGSTGVIGYTNEFVYSKPVILVARVGANAGAINKVEGRFDVSDNTLIVDSKQDTDLNFLYELLKFANLNRLVFGSGQPLITAGLLKSMYIAVPPVEEQRKIAEVLGVWDKAIELQAKIIDKLELRKRALMQRLLSGCQRLPGFSTPWQKVRMEQLFDMIDEINDGNNHIPMTISAKYGFISQQNKFDRIIAGDSLKRYTLIKQGDFAYNKGNSNLYEMGCIYSLKEKSALVPFVYICFRAKDGVCIDFYSQYFINHGLDQQLRKIITSGARGDGLLNVDKHDFFALKIPYPTYDEQSYIANILLTADKEIEITKAKLAAYRTQKRGLMQQLLTGKKQVNY